MAPASTIRADPVGGPGPELAALEVHLDQKDIYVSYLSNLLRALQVALREIARERPETRQYFAQRPQPVLSVSKISTTDGTEVHLLLVDPRTHLPLPLVSEQVFSAFLASFIQVLRAQPQLSLWGLPVIQRGKPSATQTTSQHIDQLMQVLRHFSGADLRYMEYRIALHGDRVEVEEPGPAVEGAT